MIFGKAMGLGRAPVFLAGLATILALALTAGPAGAGTCHGCPDDGGGGGGGTNAAPTVSANAASYTVNEGGSVSLSGTYDDADIGNTVTVTLDTDGDGTYESDAAGDGARSGTWSYTFSAGDRDGPGSQTVGIKASDSVDSGTTSTAVNVVNEAPTAAFGGSTSVNEGNPIILSLTGGFDSSLADRNAGFTYAFDCGSGYGEFATTNGASCSTSDSGTHTVRGKIKDKDGGERQYPHTVTINNVAPTATFNAPNSASAGGEFAVSLTSPSDPSSADIAAGLTYAFDCHGDGTFEHSGTATTATCTAGAPGTQTVNGKISDKDNGSSTYTDTVTLADDNEPTGSVVINGGAAYTKSATVGLTLSASDADQYAGAGVASMRFSHDGQVWSDWHPYAATWSWTLLSGDGTKSVHAQYKDKAGNVSAIAQDTIKLDTTVPKVRGTTPTNEATGVARNSPLTATFSEKMKKRTLTKSTFKLFKVASTGTTQVTNVTVALSSDGLKATLDPFGDSSTLLAKNTKYKAVVSIGAKDLAGNKLDQSPSKAGSQQKVWTFTTGTS